MTAFDGLEVERLDFTNGNKGLPPPHTAGISEAMTSVTNMGHLIFKKFM